METNLIEVDLFTGPGEAARQAAALIEAGEVVAMPTETVYGLAGDATRADAVAKIFSAKGRPAHDPLIVHVRSARALEGVAEVPAEVDDLFHKLTEAFWPGPLTIILPKGPDVVDAVTAGLPTVAVRCSDAPVFKAVLKLVGRPLAAPSANRFGRISPTSAAAVMKELDGRIPLVVDAGACREGVESTIVRLHPPEREKAKPRIEVLRAGPVTREMLKPFGKVEVVNRSVASDGVEPAEAPGLLDSHYAPSTPLLLPQKPEDFQPEQGSRYALLSYRGDPKDGFLGLHDWAEVEILSPGSGKLPEAAVRFYALLRRLDELGVDGIVAEPLPTHGLGLALNDRLQRAGSGG